MSPIRILLTLLAIACATGALIVPLILRRLSRGTGFDFESRGSATVVSSDVGLGAPFLLRNEELGLCGKPDYLIESRTSDRPLLVPVEVKPSRRSERLYESDRVQIGAYLIALRATVNGRASPTGYVRYQSRTFEVALTPDLENEITHLVADVRRGRTLPVLHRSHNIAGRCRACPVRPHCDESLAD
jgi:hypothetical protein